MKFCAKTICIFALVQAIGANLDNVSLEMALLDWDRVTKNEVRTTLNNVYSIRMSDGYELTLIFFFFVKF